MFLSLAYAMTLAFFSVVWGRFSFVFAGRFSLHRATNHSLDLKGDLLCSQMLFLFPAGAEDRKPRAGKLQHCVGGIGGEKALIKGEEGAGSVVTVQHQRRKGGCIFCNVLKALTKVREIIWKKGWHRTIGENRFCSRAVAKMENMD